MQEKRTTVCLNTHAHAY